jgi:hypothetical protein
VSVLSLSLSLSLSKFAFQFTHYFLLLLDFRCRFAIQVTPTMDLFVPPLQRMLAHSIADAMLQAEQSMEPVKVVVGSGNLGRAM